MSEVIPGGSVRSVTVIGVEDSNGKAAVLGGSTGVPLLVDSGIATRTPKNYYQGTVSNTAITLATLIGTTIPSGSKIAKVIFTQPVRFRDDGTNPTASVGYPIAAGVEQTFDQADLTTVKIIRQSADATADVAFYA